MNYYFKVLFGGIFPLFLVNHHESLVHMIIEMSIPRKLRITQVLSNQIVLKLFKIMRKKFDTGFLITTKI
jgi:hypothetical protein